MDGIWLVLVKVQPLPATLWLPAHQYRSATGIGYASKNYLKSWEIQVAIHPIVGGY